MPLTKRGHRPYASNWFGPKGLAAATCNLTRRVCCCCQKKATIAHHLYYRKRVWWLLWLIPIRIYGIEIPGIDTVPVCRDCHSYLHSNKVWEYGKDPDDDRGASQIISKLRCNTWGLVFLQRCWWVAVFVALGLLIVLIR